MKKVYIIEMKEADETKAIEEFFDSKNIRIIYATLVPASTIAVVNFERMKPRELRANGNV